MITEPQKLRAVLEALAAAGAAALPFYKNDTEVSYKGAGLSGSLTQADLASEAVLLKKLGQAFPSDKIISEEAGLAVDGTDAGNTWLLDPIDGTRAFINGDHGAWAVVITLLSRGTTEMSFSFYPATSDLFIAIKGGGLWVGKMLRCQQTASGDENNPDSIWTMDQAKPVSMDPAVPARAPEQMRVSTYMNAKRYQSHPQFSQQLFESCGLVFTPVPGGAVVRGFIDGIFDGWAIPQLDEWDWRPVVLQLECFGAVTSLVDEFVLIARKPEELDFLESLVRESK